MDEQIGQQLGAGALSLVVGLSGWLLPYKWNLLRLRRGFASLFSEKVNNAIPKVVGSLLILAGVAILVGTAVVGKL
ncbi:MAG: hypothetical protein JXQ73_24405 [Phycisphaerae bacterium]|nr:hypothetical protein [Phycisphaerae bacterium]